MTTLNNESFEVRFLRIAIVLGLLSAIGPFAMDMYLPAWPSLGRDLTGKVPPTTPFSILLDKDLRFFRNTVARSISFYLVSQGPWPIAVHDEEQLQRADLICPPGSLRRRPLPQGSETTPQDLGADSRPGVGNGFMPRRGLQFGHLEKITPEKFGISCGPRGQKSIAQPRVYPGLPCIGARIRAY